MPSRPSNQSLSLDRTPTPYPAANSDDRDKPPFFARLFSSASSAKKPQHHKSAGHIPASDLPPVSASAAASSTSTAAAPSSADTSEPSTQPTQQPKPTKLKFARTLSMPRLARTPTPYPEPQGPPKRKLSLSSLFGSKSSDESPSSSSTPSTLQRRAQKRLAKLSLIRAPTPYPEQAHHSKPKSWWSAKKKQTITRDGARPQIVVLRKEPMRKAQSSMYVDGEAGVSREQENDGRQELGVSTPVLNTDATVEIVDGTSKPASDAAAQPSAQPSASSSSTNTTPRAKLISFPSEPAINPNSASDSAAAVARSKSTPNRRIHILEPDLQGVSRKPARRAGDLTAPTASSGHVTATSASTTPNNAEAESENKSDDPGAVASTPAPKGSDLAARGITIVEPQTRPLPSPPSQFSTALFFSVWLTAWLPLLSHLASFAPLVFPRPVTPPTVRASMVSTSSSYHFSASDTDGDSDDPHAELGYPLDLDTLHMILVQAAAASSAQRPSVPARGAERLKRPQRRAMKRLGKGATLVKVRTARWFGSAGMDAQPEPEFGVPLAVEPAPVAGRGKQPRLPIPSEFYEDVRRGEVGGEVPPVPPLPMSPLMPVTPVMPEENKGDVQDGELPFASRACLDSVDPAIRAAFDDLMVDLTRHPSIQLSDPTTPLMRNVSSFAELAKKLTDRTREQRNDEVDAQSHPIAASRAPRPPPIPTDQVNMNFANLPDRDIASPRSTHSSIRRRKPRPSSGISESTDWSGTGSSAAAPLATTSRTSSRAPTMDSGYFPGSPPTLSSLSTSGSTSFSSSNAMPGSPTSSSIPPVPVVPAWILANPNIFPPGPGSELGSCSIATDVRPDSPDVRIEYAFHTDYATWVHHWKDLVKDTTFDQALQIGFRVPAGALGVKQVVTTGVKPTKDEDRGSRRSSISMLRRFSNVSLASISHALRHPVDAVRGIDSPRESLTPASSNASLRSSVLGGSGYHPSARPSVDGASSIASTVKSRMSLLERLRFGSIASRRSSFMMPGMTPGSLSRDMPIQETDESEWSTATAPPGPVADKAVGGKMARSWSQRGKAAKKRLSKVFGSFGFGGGAGSSGDERGSRADAEDGQDDEEDNVPLAQVMQRGSSSMSVSSSPAHGSLSRASFSLPRQSGGSSAAMSLRGTLPRSTGSASMSLRAMYTAGPSTPAPAVACASAASASMHGTSTAAALAHLTMRANGGTPVHFGGRGSAMEPFSDEDDNDQSHASLVPATLDRQGRSSTVVPPPPKLRRSLSRATQRTWTSRSLGTPSTPKSAYFPSNTSVSALSLASGGTVQPNAAGQPCEIRRSVVLAEDVDVWTIRVSLTPNVCT